VVPAGELFPSLLLLLMQLGHPINHVLDLTGRVGGELHRLAVHVDLDALAVIPLQERGDDRGQRLPCGRAADADRDGDEDRLIVELIDAAMGDAVSSSPNSFSCSGFT
jgi:hypothetical protein